MRYIGVDIGGTKCAVVLGNQDGEILQKIRFETTTLEETMEKIRGAIRELGECDAIGISCGGPLDSKRGVILSPPNLVGWDEVHITEEFEREFGVPAFLRNDADACALAEWKFGAGQGCENMIFLTFGTGLGAGLILNGRLYSGTTDSAGEVGHVRLERFGPVGYGKSGSFEGFCSGSGIAQAASIMAREAFQSGRKVSYCTGMDALDAITAKTVADAANAGNEDALAVYRQCGAMLGRGLSILIDVLNPERIVIGSVFARSENLLREEMQRVIDAECLPIPAAACRVVPAALGEQIGDVAALSVAAQGNQN
ncbi:MAG: ROK family protein [Ruminococcaceae bacterium]|nr:ROK family protein [Oscillospiraceae bacterium]